MKDVKGSVLRCRPDGVPLFLDAYGSSGRGWP
jgi:hypothetical protein